MKNEMREVILRALKEKGESVYWLSRHKRLSCHERTAWDWLKGRKDGINARYICEMCKVLGLRLTEAVR